MSIWVPHLGLVFGFGPLDMMERERATTGACLVGSVGVVCHVAFVSVGDKEEGEDGEGKGKGKGEHG